MATPNASEAGKGDVSNDVSKEKSDGAQEVKEEPSFRSIYLLGHGSYDKLKIKNLPAPRPAEDEVLIQVKACGLNFAELCARQGLYDRLPKLPAVLGYEGSGIVLEVGAKVESLKVGERVYCLQDSSQKAGMWAERQIVPAMNCLKIPDSMSFEDAAAIPVNYVTAYLMLFDFGNLRPGKKVLIHAAAGGVGWAATQLCKTVKDVTVFGTASGHKHDAIKENGVDHPIDYHVIDYAQEVLKVSPKGVDIVLDPMSGSDSAKGYGLLKPLGKIVHFGNSNMIKESRSVFSVAKTWWQMSSVSTMDLMKRNRGVCGFHLGWMCSEVELIRETLEKLRDLYSEGRIKPRIDSVWPFEHIGKAMAHMHNRKNIGKILLSPDKKPEEAPPTEDTIEEKAEESSDKSSDKGGDSAKGSGDSK